MNTTENQVLSWYPLCYHWWHRGLSLGQPSLPPVMAELALWQLSDFSSIPRNRHMVVFFFSLVVIIPLSLDRPHLSIVFCLAILSPTQCYDYRGASGVTPKNIDNISFIMNSHEVFIHIHQGCFAGTEAIVRLPQCQWSKPDGYGKISQCITTTKHSKAKTVCIFLGIYCILRCISWHETFLHYWPCVNGNQRHWWIAYTEEHNEHLCFF